jgi:hypothetical protein
MISNIWSLLNEYHWDEIYSQEIQIELLRIQDTTDEKYFFQSFGDVFEKHHTEEDLKTIIKEEKILTEYFKDWHVKTNNTFDSTTERGYHFNTGTKNLDEWLSGNGSFNVGGYELKVSEITNQKLLIDLKNHIVRGDKVAEWCFEKNCNLDALKKEFPSKKNKNIK